MPTAGTDDSYVYYRREDYAGFLRRLVCNGIDLSVLLVLGVALGAVAQVLDSEVFVWLWLLVAYLYLTVLKRGVGTLGYRVTGLRIVNLKGERPSLLMASLRLIWWVLGPINAAVDLVFLTGDENRQSIRDKMMQTYVIRKSAQPEGTGPMRTVYLQFMGATLMVFEVERKTAAPGGAAPTVAASSTIQPAG